MRRSLQTLRRQHALWLADISKFVATYADGYVTGMDMLVSDITTEDMNMKRAEHSLEERLRALLKDLQHLIAPVFTDSSVEEYLKNLQNSNKDVPIVLLVDVSLQDLPWEGLDIFRNLKYPLSRDFSIHMLGHRLDSHVKSSSSGHSSATTNPVVNASSVHCVIDPLKEDSGCTADGLVREPIINIFNHVKTASTGGNKWHVRSGCGPMSCQDWISLSQAAGRKALASSNAPAPGAGAASGGPPSTGTSQAPPTSTSSATSSQLSNNAALFLYAPGRLGSMLNPRDLSVLSMEPMALIVVSDLGHNDVSYRRQSSSDNQKQQKEIILENPLRMNALLSLCGSSCVVSHRWNTAFSSQQRFVINFWDYFTHKKEIAINSFAASCRVMDTASIARTSATKSVNNSPSRPRSRSSVKSGSISRVLNKTDGNSADQRSNNDSPPPRPVSANHNQRLKPWVALAKVMYGLPTVTYADS